MNTDDIRTTTTIVPAAPGWFVADFCPDYSPDEACFVCHPIIAWEVRCEEGRMYGAGLGPRGTAYRSASATPERKQAPTRAKAFEIARDLAIECLAREAEHRWLHGEVVSIRVESDSGG